MDDTTGQKLPADKKPGGSGMWVMNHLANPMMRLFLRSPLHGLFSGSLALITYQGRKSGNEYTIPVQYVQSGEEVYILPGGAEQKTWWRNLRGGAPVRLVLRGQNVKGMAQVLQGETDKAAIAEALVPIFSVSRPQRGSSICNLHPDGSFNSDDLGRLAASIVMVRVTLG